MLSTSQANKNSHWTLKKKVGFFDFVRSSLAKQFAWFLDSVNTTVNGDLLSFWFIVMRSIEYKGLNVLRKKKFFASSFIILKISNHPEFIIILTYFLLKYDKSMDKSKQETNIPIDKVIWWNTNYELRVTSYELKA